MHQDFPNSYRRLESFKLNDVYTFYRDNSKLCSCGGDRQVYYWDVATGRVIRKFRGHDSEVVSS